MLITIFSHFSRKKSEKKTRARFDAIGVFILRSHVNLWQNVFARRNIDFRVKEHAASELLHFPEQRDEEEIASSRTFYNIRAGSVKLRG